MISDTYRYFKRDSSGACAGITQCSNFILQTEMSKLQSANQTPLCVIRATPFCVVRAFFLSKAKLLNRINVLMTQNGV